MTTKKKKPNTTPVAPPATILNEFVERDESIEPKSEINYDTLLHLERKERKFDSGEEVQAQKVAFYCEDCKKICEAQKKGSSGLKFQCGECSGSNIYFGSELGIRNFFHVAK